MRARWISVALVLLIWAQGATAASVLVLGDSISAAFGLDTQQGWVHLLEQRLQEQGFAYQVVNASVSGDTSAGGLARLAPLLATHQPAVVIVELGGNDGLRGQPPAQLQQNLAAIIVQAQNSGARVLLLGMQLPPNYGARYTAMFSQAYSDVAAQQKVALVPFFLEGVGGVPGLMQADGIHPNAAAQQRLLENIWTQLKPLL